MADTTLSDGKGRTYLLKEGTDLIMPSKPLHLLEPVWGGPEAPPATEFWADRFMQHEKATPESKARRASYLPFGGGRHLCPGRNFAFAENLGFMVSFLLSFEVEPLDGNWAAFKVPEATQCPFTNTVQKPVRNGDDFGMKLRRRVEWEGVKWKYTSGDF